MGEMLDIYDENFVKIGVKEREAVHHDGDWHRVFHCWIAYQGKDGEAYVVMQRRSPSRQFFPDLLDISAAGHYTTGETIEDGLREVHEELGIEVTFDQLIPLGMRVAVGRDGELVDYQIEDVFLLIHDQPIQSYQPDPEEVTGLVAFKAKDGLALLNGECESITAQATGHGADEIELYRSDFIVSHDNYTAKICALVQHYFRGEKYLYI